mgnify:CR=1 FL=1
MAYAKDTSVPVSRSKAALEKLLLEHGATGILTGWDDEIRRQMVSFKMPIPGGSLVCRLNCPMPSESDRDICMTPGGKNRSSNQVDAAMEQANRSRWRTLLLKVRAKLEWIEISGTTFEEEFLSDVVMGDGLTISEKVLPQLPALSQGAQLMLGPGAG